MMNLKSTKFKLYTTMEAEIEVKAFFYFLIAKAVYIVAVGIHLYDLSVNRRYAIYDFIVKRKSE